MVLDWDPLIAADKVPVYKLLEMERFYSYSYRHFCSIQFGAAVHHGSHLVNVPPFGTGPTILVWVPPFWYGSHHLVWGPTI